MAVADRFSGRAGSVGKRALRQKHVTERGLRPQPDGNDR
jgi:hypothetical protein